MRTSRRTVTVPVLLFAFLLSGCGQGAPAAPAWRVSDQASPTSATITITVELRPACERIDRVDVTETETEIEVRPVLVTDIAPGESCPEALGEADYVVDLDAPVGDRPIAGPGHDEG